MDEWIVRPQALGGPRTTAPVRAAGAVVWRRGGPRGLVEVALVHRPRYNDWSLPKGKENPGEHPLMTAVREVREETGLTVRPGRRLPGAHYLAEGRPKHVRYWMAEVVQDHGFAPSDEVDAVRWLPVGLARRRLTYPWDIHVLDAVVTAPAHTEPVFLVRHAHAEPRQGWPGPDAERPLDTRGVRQAARLAELLALYGPHAVWTSDAVRCVQTIAPYAAAEGVVPTEQPALSERGFATRPTRARALVRTLVRGQSSGVVCTHRPVLPGLVHEAFELGGDRSPAPPRRGLARAECLVLHTARHAVVAWDRFTARAPESRAPESCAPESQRRPPTPDISVWAADRGQPEAARGGNTDTGSRAAPGR